MKIFRPISQFKSLSHNWGYSRASDNWVENTRYYPNGYDTINKRTISNIFRYIHYRAWHAPAKVQLKWRKVERKFSRKHAPWYTHYNWATKYTANRWL
jgi:hypothetical protein